MEIIAEPMEPETDQELIEQRLELLAQCLCPLHKAEMKPHAVEFAGDGVFDVVRCTHDGCDVSGRLIPSPARIELSHSFQYLVGISSIPPEWRDALEKRRKLTSKTDH